jgi:hypothetical protein
MSEQTDQSTAETEEAPPEDTEAEPTQEDTGPDPALADKFRRAREMGITGDPDAPPGYVVDENFRPNPLDVGTLNTTEVHGISAYDLPRHAGVFDPTAVPENPNPTEVEPVPQAVATDYDPSARAGVLAEVTPQEDPSAAITRQTEGVAAGTVEDTGVEAQAQTQAQPEVAEPAQPVAKATKATKATKAPSPAGTKDSALEPTPEGSEGGPRIP